MTVDESSPVARPAARPPDPFKDTRLRTGASRVVVGRASWNQRGWRRRGSASYRSPVPSRVQRLVGAVRNLPLPEGTYAIALGFVIGGIAAYAFQILAAADL